MARAASKEISSRQRPPARGDLSTPKGAAEVGEAESCSLASDRGSGGATASKGGAGECALDVEGMGFKKAENRLPLEASCTLALWRFGGPLLVLIAASSVHNIKEKSVASSAFCLRQVPELGWARLLGARARALEVGPFDGA